MRHYRVLLSLVLFASLLFLTGCALPEWIAPEPPAQGNPASEEKIFRRAQKWARHTGVCDAKIRDTLHDVNLFANNVTFSHKIGYLLLAEAMWAQLKDGDFYAGTSLVKLALKTLPTTTATHAALRAAGLKALGPVFTAAEIVRIGFEWFWKNLTPDLFNSQLVAYLSWRGWFFERGGFPGWRYVYALGNSHEEVMGKHFNHLRMKAYPWFCHAQDYAIDEPLRQIHFHPPRVLRERSDRLFNLGNTLYYLLHRVDANELVFT